MIGLQGMPKVSKSPSVRSIFVTHTPAHSHFSAHVYRITRSKPACIQPFTPPARQLQIAVYLEPVSAEQEWPFACHYQWQPSLWLEPKTKGRRIQMKDKFMKLLAKAQALLMDEEGQDLIEYALVVALIAFAATAGMSKLATSINSAFTTVGTTLSTYIT
jgi:pilus assembly protein Flp/PilA